MPKQRRDIVCLVCAQVVDLSHLTLHKVPGGPRYYATTRDRWRYAWDYVSGSGRKPLEHFQRDPEEAKVYWPGVQEIDLEKAVEAHLLTQGEPRDRLNEGPRCDCGANPLYGVMCKCPTA